MLERLPNELVLYIASYLEPPDLVNVQSTSRRLLNLARDNDTWKAICFEHSRAEAARRREIFFSQDTALSELARAMNDIRGQSMDVHDHTAPSAEMQVHHANARRKRAVMAKWDPEYPSERLNFYQEYVHRHALIAMQWFQNAKYGLRDEELYHEATGIGVLYREGEAMVDKVYAPLDDGSIAIWDIGASQYGSKGTSPGRMISRSDMGLLSGLGPEIDRDTRLGQSKVLMTETGAVECVSIDSRLKRGYFAVQDVLNEVDLDTLQVISRTPHPFPITALSEARHPTPLTVGTNWTIHLHDHRSPDPTGSLGNSDPSVKCELIAGTPPKNDISSVIQGDLGARHSNLSQPGALSILHMPSERDWDGNGDIWVAGRFTSMLNYDRRFFPRVRGTVHSGARISCLTSAPHSFIPLDERLMRNEDLGTPRKAKSIPGTTMLAAGEYKGKGSLELYSLSSDPLRSISSTDSRTMRNQHTYYHNRQTAAGSKLLSVAPHGGRLAFSDGDGNVKWVERDGFTPVRQFNINDEMSGYDPVNASTNPEVPSDIVQKMVPVIAPSALGNNDAPIGQDNLIVWTGDGKLGMIGFGEPPFSDALEEQAESFEEKEQMRQEREYGQEMRRALERQAAELKWMASYGMEV